MLKLTRSIESSLRKLQLKFYYISTDWSTFRVHSVEKNLAIKIVIVTISILVSK